MALAYLLFGNATGPVIFRELDPAMRAFLRRGDAAPLLRLVAEGGSIADSRDTTYSPRYYSVGQFAAVSCTDFPQLYDMTAPIAVRRAQLDRAIRWKRQSDPEVYAPFTIAEYRGMAIDYSVLDLCLEWPVPPERFPPGQPVPLGAAFPRVPTLVLSGELDSITPPDDGVATAQLFPNARWLLFRNSFHVVAVDDPAGCAADIVRRFIQSGGPIGDTGCGRDLPAVRLVPEFAERVVEVAPAAANPANQAPPAVLQVAAAVIHTAGDAIARWHVNYAWAGGGLRGGRFAIEATDTGYAFTLAGLRWTEDLAVTGTLAWNTASGAIRGDLTLLGPAALSGRVIVRWNDRRTPGDATIVGRIGSYIVDARLPAP